MLNDTGHGGLTERFSSNNVLSVTLNLTVTRTPGMREPGPSLGRWEYRPLLLSRIPRGAPYHSGTPGKFLSGWASSGQNLPAKSSKGEDPFSSCQFLFQIAHPDM